MIHHVAITPADFGASKKFYTEVMGFPVVKAVKRQAMGGESAGWTKHVFFERTVLAAAWERVDERRLAFRLTADALVRHMMRVLVGTMLERPDPEHLATLLEDYFAVGRHGLISVGESVDTRSAAGTPRPGTRPSEAAERDPRGASRRSRARSA